MSTVSRFCCRVENSPIACRCRPAPYTRKKYVSSTTAPSVASMPGALPIAVHRLGARGLSVGAFAVVEVAAPAALAMDSAALLAWSTCLVSMRSFGVICLSSVGTCRTQSVAGPISRLARKMLAARPPNTTASEPIQRGIHSLRSRAHDRVRDQGEEHRQHHRHQQVACGPAGEQHRQQGQQVQRAEAAFLDLDGGVVGGGGRLGRERRDGRVEVVCHAASIDQPR